MANVPRFLYYLTTRGLNAEGGILSLDYLPESFHPFITVVSGREFEKSITKRYPEIGGYWANPDDVTTASGKRKWIHENSPVDDFFLINAETRFYTEVGEGKARVAKNEPDHFFRNVRRMEDLTDYYVGVAANQKPFSGGLLKSASMLRDNYVISAWFYWNRKFANKHIEFDRVNYLDDCDYVLQALYKGYRVCNFAGILYEHRTNVPQRQFADRTESVQERDTKRLMKMHPNCVFRKPGYDPVNENIGVNIKFAKAYQPKKSVLIVSSESSKAAASALYLAVCNVRKGFQVKLVGLGSSPGPMKDIPVLKDLRSAGLPTHGLDVGQLSARHLNQADVVCFLSSKDMKATHKLFPRADTSKFRLVPTGDNFSVSEIKALRDLVKTGYLEESSCT
jgi:hypothetical protein